MEYNNRIPALIQLVKKAGEEILRIYHSDADINVQNKADDSPVTKADLRSNKILVEGLRKMDESIPIVSEENKTVPYSERKSFDRFWIIDPLDGTKEFINRLDEFTIHLALIENDKVTMGFIYAPVFDEMYYAAKGIGAWSLTDTGKKKLSGHRVDYRKSRLKIMRSRSNLDPQTMEYINHFDEPELITMGSGLKFTRLVTGEADYYPRAKTHMYEWDIAPAQIILEEAGGGIFDWESDQPLRYNKENLKITGFQAVSLVPPPGKLFS